MNTTKLISNSTRARLCGLLAALLCACATTPDSETEAVTEGARATGEAQTDSAPVFRFVPPTQDDDGTETEERDESRSTKHAGGEKELAVADPLCEQATEKESNSDHQKPKEEERGETKEEEKTDATPPEQAPEAKQTPKQQQQQSEQTGEVGKNTAAQGWQSPCQGSQVSKKVEAEILQLCDTKSLATVSDVKARIDGIAERFGACKDRRGLFAEVYKVITARAQKAVQSGTLEHEAWARAFIVDFAARYLDNLAAHLEDGEPNDGWKRYYDLAQMKNVSKTRIAVTGVVAHLTVDLPWCLVAIGTQEKHKKAYFAFGDELGKAADDLVVALDKVYGAKSKDIIRGFFLGKWIDGAFGKAVTTNLSFQTLRLKSWNNRWLIQKKWGGMIAKIEIASAFNTIDVVLATLDASGVLDDD